MTGDKGGKMLMPKGGMYHANEGDFNQKNSSQLCCGVAVFVI